MDLKKLLIDLSNFNIDWYIQKDTDDDSCSGFIELKMYGVKNVEIGYKTTTLQFNNDNEIELINTEYYSIFYKPSFKVTKLIIDVR